MGTAILYVTKGVRRVTSADVVDGVITAPKDETVEVLGYRAMRLTLRVWLVTPSAPTPIFVIAMQTGMSIDDPAGFVSLGVFDALPEKPTVVNRVFTDLQRFARWQVEVFQNIDDAQFSIEGVVYE